MFDATFSRTIGPSRRLLFGAFATLVIALAAPSAGAVRWELSGPPTEEGRWVVEIALRESSGSGRSPIDRLVEIVEPWAVYPEKGMALAEVDADLWRELDLEGFELSIDFPRTIRLGAPPEPLPGQTGGIPGFPCYATVEESFAAAEALVAERPDLARWTDIGDSWGKSVGGQGYDLQVLEIASPAVPEDAPALLAFGGLHAREYATAELVLRFAEELVADYDRDAETTWILDHHRIYLVLQANPDGRKEAEAGKLWRKNRNNRYCANSDDRGADLNRNFSFGWDCCGGGSDDPCSTTYRGPAAASEPESEAYEALMRWVFPDQRGPRLDDPADEDGVGIFIDVHSFGEDVLWSWGFTTDRPPNDEALYSLGRKLAFFNEYRPQHGSLSTVDGATKDFAYGELGVPGFTLELGTDFFQDCSSFESKIAPDNLAMLRYAAKVVRAPYREPSGPEAVEPTVPPRVFFQGERVEVTALLDDTRYNQSNGFEPSQPIVAGELSIDAPPWTAAETVPLLPVDGRFDDVVEEVFAQVDTTDLAPGRHTLYLRGLDADGRWGATSAVFLYVAEPQVVSVVEGFVREVGEPRPVEAEVRVGPFSTQTDPRTGRYRITLPPLGRWPVEVRPASRAEHESVATEWRFDHTAGATARSNFRLARREPLASLVLTPRGGWAVNTLPFFGELVEVWSDSPDGPYAPRSERFLTSQAIGVDGVDEALLLFRHAYDFESGFDFGAVELSRDGAPWEVVERYSGSRSQWEEVELPLGDLRGVETIRLRFRATSDESVEGDGWVVADPAVVGRPAN